MGNEIYWIWKFKRRSVVNSKMHCQFSGGVRTGFDSRGQNLYTLCMYIETHAHILHICWVVVKIFFFFSYIVKIPFINENIFSN